MFLPNAKFDHVVIFVADLNRAIVDFTALGFQVTLGGSHGATENALVIFRNQTYIELLALRSTWYCPLIKLAIKLNILQRQAGSKTNIYARLTSWICGETGPVDWCVRVNDLNAALALWASQDLEVLHSDTFSRERADGQIAQWKLGGSRQAELPFLLQDITPVATRVPTAGTAEHVNGAKDLVSIQLGVSDTKVAGHRLKKSLLSEAQHKNKTEQEFSLGNMAISYADMQSVGYKFALEVAYAGEQVQYLDIKRTHGIKITLIPI